MENNDITNKYFLPASVILAGIFIAGAVLWNGSRPVTGTEPGGGAAAPKVDIKNVKTAGNPFIGEENAPVTIAFWSDFQCPFCKAAEVGGIPQIPTPPSLPDIIKNYVETGKVKVVFMDLPPEISWARRWRKYEQRLIYFPKGQHRAILQKYKDYMEKTHGLLREVYERLPFAKETVDASLPQEEVLRAIYQSLARLSRSFR